MIFFLSFLSANIKLKFILWVCPTCGLDLGLFCLAGPWAFLSYSTLPTCTSVRVSTLCSASLQPLNPFLIFLSMQSCLWIKAMLLVVQWNNQSELHWEWHHGGSGSCDGLRIWFNSAPTTRNSSLPLKEELSHPCFLPSIPAAHGCIIWSLLCKHLKSSV